MIPAVSAADSGARSSPAGPPNRRDSPSPESSSAGEPSATTRPCVDDDDPVGQPLGLVHEVGGEHDGDAVGAQLARRRPRRRAGPAGRGRRSARRGRPARGRPTTATARASRCRWPPESRRTVVRACPVSPSRSSRSPTGSGRACSAATCRSTSPARAPVGSPPSWSITPTLARSAASARHGSRPSTRTVPAVRTAQALAALHRRRLAGAVRAEDGRSPRPTGAPNDRPSTTATAAVGLAQAVDGERGDVGHPRQGRSPGVELRARGINDTMVWCNSVPGCRRSGREGRRHG